MPCLRFRSFSRLLPFVALGLVAVILTACVTPGNNTSSSSTTTSSSSSSSTVSSSPASSSSAPAVNTGYRQGEFILGMDYSYWSEHLDRGVTYTDTDGESKDVLALFKNHGINYIRLRTFVDPSAQYGYASDAGSCNSKPQAYNGKDDIVRMAKRVKAAGMGLLLDFHYSDTWADPSKQVIPEAWRDARSISELADEVRHYTTDVLETLKAENALPNMVQVGNEITPGMLIHVPTSSTDCWGNNSTENGLTGRSSNANWGNLATLLQAGLEAVNNVDPDILTMLHIENFHEPSGVEWWVNSALTNGVQFDVLGLSAYEAFQGPASAWRTTIQRLSDRFPELAFTIAEYNSQGRLLNDIMRDVPDNRGLGTFFWEPTESGFWGDAIFTWQGNTARANADDFAVYDQIVEDYDLRKLP